MRAATHRPSLEVLEDRLTPSFACPADYATEEFNQMTGPDFAATSDMSSGVTADFNADGRLDLFTVTFPGMGDFRSGAFSWAGATGPSTWSKSPSR